MKNLHVPLLCLCITFMSNLVSAQDIHPLAPKTDLNKPKLFSNLSDKIKVSVDELSSLIEKQTGNTTSVKAASDSNQTIQFSGNIVFSVTDEQSKLKSVMLNLPQFPGARLTLTQLTHPDGTKEYAARILSFEHGDAYLLEKNGNEYAFIKKGYYELVNQ